LTFGISIPSILVAAVKPAWTRRRQFNRPPPHSIPTALRSRCNIVEVAWNYFCATQATLTSPVQPKFPMTQRGEMHAGDWQSNLTLRTPTGISYPKL
jgi:hypothetical protein